MADPNRHFVIGMAGHIDHGKTALVQALTGINTDRLREEQERGITIDLGFAHLSENVTIIDVPGHERLVKNMVAGVSTIDLVLFVVAADDGVMPQTREHLDIINLLGIENGIFIVTKTDLVEEEWLLLVEEEVRDILSRTAFKDAPVLKASAVTGEGIEEIRKELARNLENIKPRTDDGIFRLPVDRVFTKPGFGTVITGSVLSGSINSGQAVEILPQKLQARVRGLHSHDHKVESVKPGFRAALNLAGVEMEQLHRGQVITLPGFYDPVVLFNARLNVLPDSPAPIQNQMRLRVHVHTREVFARIIIPESKVIAPGESGFVQFRLEEPVYASFRDRFIIRQYSPQVTLGGGVVLNTNPPKYRKKYLEEFKESLEGLESSDGKTRVAAIFSVAEIRPYSPRELQVKVGLEIHEIDAIIHDLQNKQELFRLAKGGDQYYYSGKQLEMVLALGQRVLQRYHTQFPGRPGMRPKELSSRIGRRYPDELIQLAVTYGLKNGNLKQTGEAIASGEFQSGLSQPLQEKMEKIEQLYKKADFNPPTYAEALNDSGLAEKEFKELVNILREQGSLILVEEKLFFHGDVIRRIVSIIREHFRQASELTVTQFKDLTGTTRKFAIPLLTYLDNSKITLRQGDVRIAGSQLNAV